MTDYSVRNPRVWLALGAASGSIAVLLWIFEGTDEVPRIVLGVFGLLLALWRYRKLRISEKLEIDKGDR